MLRIANEKKEQYKGYDILQKLYKSYLEQNKQNNKLNQDNRQNQMSQNVEKNIEISLNYKSLDSQVNHNNISKIGRAHV